MSARFIESPALQWPPLPQPVTSIIGREEELAKLADLLRRSAVRVVTLTGPGGVGKTRLAVHVAETVRPDFAGRVGWVPLASIQDPEMVLPAIAHRLGLLEGDRRTLGGRLQTLLGDQPCLLVLDNFEQVVGAAPVVSGLLQICSQLKLLVTSRARLRIRGERVYPVPPLALAPPGMDAEVIDAAAVRLFIERALAVRPDVTMTEASAPAIAAICARLDGLPLAIELAAARTGLLAPPALLARLKQRLPLLTGGSCDQPARLQTMHAAIDWSYDLLCRDEQAFFRRLAVFAGGFSLTAAMQITAASEIDALQGLAVLIDQSLLLAETCPDNEPRYSMLETIRDFGLEQMTAAGEADDTRHRHADYFLALAEESEPVLSGPDQRARLDRLDRDHPNLRAALTWFITLGEAGSALRLAAALLRFWEMRGYLTEGRDWLTQAIALPETVDPDVRASALWRLSHLDLDLGEYGDARCHAEQSLSLAAAVGDELGMGRAWKALGLLARLSHQLAAARSCDEQALAYARAADDAAGIGTALANLADVAHLEGDLDRARALHEEALAIRRELDSPRELAYQYVNLASLALTERRLQEAAEWADRALAGFEALGEEIGVAEALGISGRIALAAGDPERAMRILVQVLDLRRRLHLQRGMIDTIEAVAYTVAPFDPAMTARLLGAADAKRGRTGVPRLTRDGAAWDRAVSTAHGALGAARFDAEWPAGRTWPLTTTAEAAEVALMSLIPTLMAPRPDVSSLSGRPGKGDGTLSPREGEVLRLVAAGLTNREIAETLFLSPATVKRHVTNILAKLDLPTRAAAISYAHRAGLLAPPAP